MKTCPECQTSYPVTRVLCLRCSEILEERQFIRMVYVTLAIAFAFHFLLGKAGYSGSGLVRESFMTEVLLLSFVVVVWKLRQKSREPNRRVLYELASLYSDRTGRAIILGGVIFVTLISLGIGTPIPSARPVQPDFLIFFRKLRFWIVAFSAFAYFVLALRFQGAALFDFRLKNSLEPQEGSADSGAIETGK